MIINNQEAILQLKAGGIVAIPTETVYGLAASISSRRALEAVFAAKQRPFFDPLIVHVAETKQALALTDDWSELAQYLANRFWPGPLTLVLSKSAKVDPLITSGLETVAIRCPRHPVAREIINGVGEPLAAPSANLFGKTSPTRAQHVELEFQSKIAVVDGGPSEVGVESTVVAIVRAAKGYELQVLRPGGVSLDDLHLAGKSFHAPVTVTRQHSQASPGHLKEHYQPRLPLVLVHRSGNAVEAALSPQETAEILAKLNLPESRWKALAISEDPHMAARELYHELRELSQAPLDFLVYFAKPSFRSQSWDAIRDRLGRAASLILVSP